MTKNYHFVFNLFWNQVPAVQKTFEIILMSSLNCRIFFKHYPNEFSPDWEIVSLFGLVVILKVTCF